MKTLKTVSYFILFSFFIGLSSCEEENSVKLENPQAIYFEINYINYAWGEQANGLIIDKEGAVKTYKGKPKWDLGELKGKLNENQVSDKLLQANVSKKTVSSADLKKYSGLIKSISSSNFSKKIGVGADMGTTTYYAYLYDSDKKQYEGIKLAELGDFESHNLDKNAILITDWLKKVQQESL